jgi:hypothetical protein
MDLIVALAAATKSLELAKAIMDADKHYSQAELKAKAADLLSNLADVKVALVNAHDQIAEKDKEIARLKSAFQLREETVRVENFLYDKDDQGRPVGLPYCYRCEQVDGIMIKASRVNRGYTTAMCPQCKTAFEQAQIFSHP